MSRILVAVLPALGLTAVLCVQTVSGVQASVSRPGSTASVQAPTLVTGRLLADPNSQGYP